MGGGSIRPQHFEADDIVFNQGDLGDSVYVIHSGECEVWRDGRMLAVLAAGDYFGEMAVMSDKTRNATVRARGPTDVLLIPKEDFGRLRDNLPAFAEVFREASRKREGA